METESKAMESAKMVADDNATNSLREIATESSKIRQQERSIESKREMLEAKMEKRQQLMDAGASP
jgi:hypothetical protein